MPVNLLWVGESALACECQLLLTYKKITVIKKGQGSWRGFFVALGKSTPNSQHPYLTMSDPRIWWLAVLTVDEVLILLSMNFNQIIMRDPEYIFGIKCNIYARFIGSTQQLSPTWILFGNLFLGRDQMSIVLILWWYCRLCQLLKEYKKY